jgi:molybdate/tungstate transport system ATP-binding protein
VIAVENLSVRAGSFHLDGLSLQVPTGRYAVLMGRTGSGKTTILETICGLNRARKGRIRIMGRDVTRLKPAERQIGYVPQDRALFATMSVRENLAFALRIRNWSKAEIEHRVSELAQTLDIKKLLDRVPASLSGGETQRVALGRALASNPPVLLLDEPLSALDDQSRNSMHELLISVRRQKPVTVLHVTHHLHDAERLADDVYMLDEGVLSVQREVQAPITSGEGPVSA